MRLTPSKPTFLEQLEDQQLNELKKELKAFQKYLNTLNKKVLIYTNLSTLYELKTEKEGFSVKLAMPKSYFRRKEYTISFNKGFIDSDFPNLWKLFAKLRENNLESEDIGLRVRQDTHFLTSFHVDYEDIVGVSIPKKAYRFFNIRKMIHIFKRTPFFLQIIINIISKSSW